MTAPTHAFIGVGAMMNPMTTMMPAAMGMGGMMAPMSKGSMGRMMNPTGMMPARGAMNPMVAVNSLAGGHPRATIVP